VLKKETSFNRAIGDANENTLISANNLTHGIGTMRFAAPE